MQINIWGGFPPQILEHRNMKIFIWISVLFLPFGLFSQNSFRQVKMYHKLINKAELNICNENFKKANAQYKQAFKKVEAPFSIDLYNYLLLNLKLETDTSITNVTLRALVQRGYKLKYLKKRLDVYAFPGVVRLDTSIFDFRICKNKLAIQMDSFVMEDQQMRKYVMDSISEYYNIYGQDTLTTFDSINCLNLIKVMKYDFPDESTGFINSSPICEPRYTLVFYHCNSWMLHGLYDSLTYNEIFSGRFAPEWYVHLFFERNGVDSLTQGKYGNPIEYLSDCNNANNEVIKIWKSYSKKQLRIINKNRKKIFLEKYQEYEIKTKYEFENKIFYFTYNKHIAYC